MATFKLPRRNASVDPPKKRRPARTSTSGSLPRSKRSHHQGSPPEPQRGNSKPTDLAPVATAEVMGPLAIPQITVGSPSPSIEPVATNKDYRSHPFRPDLTIDGWSTDSATVRGASQRGHLHRYNGAPRQDDFATHVLPDGRIIAVVADGVSSAKQSHIGATAAVNYAAGWLATHVADNISDTDWAMLVRSTAYRLAEQAQTLFQLEQPDPVVAEQELATTLVCAVIEPFDAGRMRAHLVGVGDSGAWLLSPSGFREVLGGKAESSDGITSSAVVGLPRVPSELTATVVDVDTCDILLIGTDGVGDALGSGEGGVGNMFRDVLTAAPPPSLIEFAHALDFSRENFDDDRTLVAVWPRHSGTDQ